MTDVACRRVNARLADLLAAGADSADDETVAAAALIICARGQADNNRGVIVQCDNGWRVVATPPGHGANNG